MFGNCLPSFGSVVWLWETKPETETMTGPCITVAVLTVINPVVWHMGYREGDISLEPSDMHRCSTEIAQRKRKEVRNGVESGYFLSSGPEWACFSPSSEQWREMKFKNLLPRKHIQVHLCCEPNHPMSQARTRSRLQTSSNHRIFPSRPSSVTSCPHYDLERLWREDLLLSSQWLELMHGIHRCIRALIPYSAWVSVVGACRNNWGAFAQV